MHGLQDSASGEPAQRQSHECRRKAVGHSPERADKADREMESRAQWLMGTDDECSKIISSLLEKEREAAHNITVPRPRA
jgi:hypothetical protein